MTTRPRQPKTRIALTAQHRQQNHEEWKDTLRQACVNRARKNRRDLIWRKRQQHQPQNIDNNSNSNEITMVRTVVEQELRQQGVAVVSPGLFGKSTGGSSYYDHQNNQSPISSGVHPSSPTTGYTDAVEEEYALSEEELYELLQEVEEEMRRSEEELLEEVLEQERCQQEEMEQQIADYEEWEESHCCDQDECVICPICCEGVLKKSSAGSTIYCGSNNNNTMDACSWQQELKIGRGQDLSLAELKERLRVAFEEHSYQCCSSGTLTFELRPGEENIDSMEEICHHLIASCHHCDVTSRII